MRVRYVKNHMDPTSIRCAGEIHNLRPEAARAAIALGAAVAIGDDGAAAPEPGPEAATLETRETAMIDAPDESARRRRRE
jgi:hypothetical protein